MARLKNEVKALDDRIQFSLPDLRKEKYLEDGCSGSFTWYKGDHAIARVDVRVVLDEEHLHGPASGWLLLRYEHQSGPMNQQIQLIQQPSNLGRGGGIWYAVCPKTGRQCRTLYFDQLSFVSRWAINKGLYLSQQVSKSDRDFRRTVKCLNQLEQLGQLMTKWLGKPHSKRTYRGKLTRSMQRYLALMQIAGKGR